MKGIPHTVPRLAGSAFTFQDPINILNTSLDRHTSTATIFPPTQYIAYVMNAMQQESYGMIFKLMKYRPAVNYFVTSEF